MFGLQGSKSVGSFNSPFMSPAGVRAVVFVSFLPMADEDARGNGNAENLP